LWASLGELGQIQREQNHADCVAFYREALDLAELLALRSEAATAAFNLGRALEDVPAVRDLDQAEHWYRRSLDLRDERDRVGRVRCHGQIGSVAFSRFRETRAAGRPESELLAALNAALAAYHQALALLPADAVNDLAVAHNALGAIYKNAGDFDRALPHYRECIRLAEGSGNLYQAGATRFNVALALMQSGRLTDAREYARAALRNFKPYGPGAAAETQQTQQLLARIEQARAGAALTRLLRRTARRQPAGSSAVGGCRRTGARLDGTLHCCPVDGCFPRRIFQAAASQGNEWRLRNSECRLIRRFVHSGFCIRCSVSNGGRNNFPVSREPAASRGPRRFSARSPQATLRGRLAFVTTLLASVGRCSRPEMPPQETRGFATTLLASVERCSRCWTQ
jgi:tetratricopeptide (TPR) repeat protein